MTRLPLPAACLCALTLAACPSPLDGLLTGAPVPLTRAAFPAGSYEQGGLLVMIALLSPSEQVEQFNVDMELADVTPVRMLVRNDAGGVLRIRSEQVLGHTIDGATYPAYRLDQTVRRVRGSRVGRAMASGSVTGTVIRVRAANPGVAAVGMTTDGAGASAQGAILGAAAAGAAGGLSGAAAGADVAAGRIATELRKIDWGRRVVGPGRTERGYLFFKPGVTYAALDVQVYDADTGQTRRLRIVLN